MTGSELIAQERKRQITVEGWTPEHDDQHDRGELVRASVCYALDAHWARDGVPPDWPWDSKWWKPTPDDRVHELIKAGALIAAEIDRLQRASSRSETGS